MKLLAVFDSEVSATEASHKLEQAGVASYISFKRLQLIPITSGGTRQFGLWVLLDSQIQDAEAVLRNPDHKVRNQLSGAEIEELRQSIRNSGHAPALRALMPFLIAAITVAIVAYFLVNS